VNKTLRIFVKDTRHLWPEVLLALALTAGFAATDHYAWAFSAHPELQQHKEFLRGCLEFLMPIAWWLLIARAVHDESLVGDRQFWITRPYGWQRVLSAKLLFIAAFICVPFFLAQVFLLHQAGLHPLLVLPGLLRLMLLLCGFVLLPLLAFSAVTPTLTRMILVVLGLIVYIALVMYGCFSLGHPTNAAPGNGDQGEFIIWLIPLAYIAVTFLQYMRRRTIVSAGVLTATVLALTAVVLVNIYSTAHVRGYSVLAFGEAPPITAALDPDQQFQYAKPSGDHEAYQPEPRASVPLSLSVATPGKAVTVEGQMVEYEADGVKGSLPWDRSGSSFITVGSPFTTEAPIPYNVYAKINARPVTLRVTYAVTEYDPEPAQTVWFDGKTLDIPDHGHCVAQHWGGDLQCLYALSKPGPALVSWQNTEACSLGVHAHPAGSNWIGPEGSFDPGFSPIEQLNGLRFNYPTFTSFAAACRGTRLTFTKYHISRKRLVTVTLPSIDVTLYRFPHKTVGFSPMQRMH
jgi:hypothetical protein